MRRCLLLNGFMGTGKSTVGRLAGPILGLPFLDLDDDIERRTGMTVPEVFERMGEERFRSLERDALAEAVCGRAQPAVVALGGGALVDTESRLMTEDAGAVIVTLRASPRELERRLGSDESRPLNRGRTGAERLQTYERMLGERASAYDAYPTVETSDLEPPEVAKTVAHIYGEIDRSGLDQVYSLSFGGGLFVNGTGRGLSGQTQVGFLDGVDEEGLLAAVLGWLAADRQFALITDSNLARFWPRLVESTAQAAALSIVLAPGEKQKNLSIVETAYARLQEAGLGRDAMVLGIGGGVVCDLAGFVAATYMRGLELALAPTTLLAQGDAAIGGKTGVDFGGSKNVVGSFHPAARVLIAPTFQKTLPHSVRREGTAEIIKIAFVRNERLIQQLEAEDSAEIGSRSLREAVRSKIEIVTADPLERTGTRAVLNFGHTIGHGVETITEYGVPHGEAVAMGMVVEARVAQRRGYIGSEVVARLIALLRRHGLPVGLPQLEYSVLLKSMEADKKRRKGKLHMVMLRGLGRGELEAVDEPEVLRALESANEAVETRT